MKFFLKNVFIFFALVLFCVLLIDVILGALDRKYMSFKLNSNINYIVVGDSHPAYAYNDSLIDNFKNTANAGESYFYSYIKTKLILDASPSIKTVFIELEDRQMNKSMDRWIWNENYILGDYQKYVSFMTLNDKLLLLKNNPKWILSSAFTIATKGRFQRLFKKDFFFTEKYGGYMHSERAKTDSMITAISSKRQQSVHYTDSISDINLFYLSALIDYCKGKQLEVVLVRSPLHKAHNGEISETLYKKILEKQFRDLTYIDFSKFPLKNAEFGDFTHLNSKGARKYSVWFNHLLKSGILEKENKQSIIDHEIEQYMTEETINLKTI